MKKVLVILTILVIYAFNFQIAKADFFEDGIVAYRNSNFKQAEYSFKQAIKINPDNARYRYYLAITLVQQGNILDAENEYRRVIALSPGSEAAEKSEKGLELITLAKQNYISDKHPKAMTSVLQSSSKKVVIPINQNKNAIIVPKVLINNDLYVNFLLDTGATYTSISKATALKLGFDLDSSPKVTLKTANGIIKVPKIILKTININGLIANNVEVTVHDLPAATNVTGLLGLSFLDKFTVTIDKKNNRIIIDNT
ncbi:MAG: TIGR02281 family clan AA aspartic protease [Cyanobacteriota bacterium]